MLWISCPKINEFPLLQALACPLERLSMSKSSQLFERAQTHLVGGVNSPVRAFSSVGGTPVFIERAFASKIIDVDGREYIDYVGSWGPMILGHGHPNVVDAIKAAIDKGTSYGAPTEAEIALAEKIYELVPSMEMSRLVSSGTEACMGAIRAARGFTGRDLIVKCVGAYHGGADYLLVKAGSGAATLGSPDSAGVPEAFAQTTLLLPHNDLGAAKALFAEHGARIAAMIVEPVVGNMGCVPPKDGYLPGLAALTKEHGALLIFDEVMTGFRVARGGAQGLYDVKPDLTCLGKIVGGGMPLAAYGGRRDVMQKIAPLGPVYQAGTLSGNPVAVAAGLATLELLNDSVYARIETIGAKLETGIKAAAKDASADVCVQRVGGMITVFMNDGSPVQNWDASNACDRERFSAWHRKLLNKGVYWPPSPFEAAFPSAAHTDADIEHTLKAISAAF